MDEVINMIRGYSPWPLVGVYGTCPTWEKLDLAWRVPRFSKVWQGLALKYCLEHWNTGFGMDNDTTIFFRKIFVCATSCDSRFQYVF